MRVHVSFYSLLHVRPEKLRPGEGRERWGGERGRGENENEVVEFIFANLYPGTWGLNTYT